MTLITEYEVRCCCQPTKLLGWLQAPAGMQHGERLKVIERQPLPLLLPPDSPPPMASTTVHEVRFEAICGAEACYVAVYSEDRPIEFWRTLLGFREAPSHG